MNKTLSIILMSFPLLSFASDGTIAKFKAEVALPTGDETSVTNAWTIPESFQQGESTWTIFDIHGNSSIGMFSFSFADTNSVPRLAGRGIALLAQSEARLRDFVVGRIVNNAFVPADYSLQWDVTSLESDLMRIQRLDEESTGHNLDPCGPSYVLYKNVCVSVSGISNACQFAESILRAGGVEIPDEEDSPAP